MNHLQDYANASLFVYFTVMLVFILIYEGFKEPETITQEVVQNSAFLGAIVCMAFIFFFGVVSMALHAATIPMQPPVFLP